MTEQRQRCMGKREVLALRGLRLPAPALKCLREAGIYCEPAVSIERQQRAGRYVLRSMESGGAVAHFGAYSSCVGPDGRPLPWLHKVTSVARNGLRAVVIAPELVRLHIFRSERSYDLLITGHRLEPLAGSARPKLRNDILFHGVHGTLATDFPGTESQIPPQGVPIFYTRGGEPLFIPEEFHEATRRITAASSCVGCRHCHLLEPGAGATTLAG